MEDTLLAPPINPVKNSDIFHAHRGLGDLKLIKSNKTNSSGYAKNYAFAQRFGKLRKNLHEKQKSFSAAPYEPFNSFDEYPCYLGYYFREIYRSTIKNLKQEGKKGEYTEYPSEDSEEDTKLPEMTQKQIDDNKTHVTQSMQGLHYMNSVKAGNGYESKKVILPSTTRTKLAIFDMDETLIH